MTTDIAFFIMTAIVDTNKKTKERVTMKQWAYEECTVIKMCGDERKEIR